MRLSAKKCGQILVFRKKIDDMWGGSKVKSEYAIHAIIILLYESYELSIISIRLSTESKMKYV